MKTSIVVPSFVLLANAIAIDTLSHPSLLLGPVFLPPRHLSTNFGFLATYSQLSSALKSALEQGQSPYGNFTPNASSVSISMTSTGQASPIFSLNFTGSNLNTSAGGTEHVSVDTVFRIGSISKLFTVYTFLLNNGLELWQRPITEYVPELRQFSQHEQNSVNLDSVKWEEVTLGSLASHMSGIGRDCEYRSGQGAVIQLTNHVGTKTGVQTYPCFPFHGLSMACLNYRRLTFPRVVEVKCTRGLVQERVGSFVI